MTTGKFDKFAWLKRTDGHKFTGAEFRVLVSIFNHADGHTGREAYPGIDLMAEETTYRRTGVSEAVASLRAKGWIHETYRGNGRAMKASSFDLVPDAPNPGYRCPSDRAARCATCSNGSALAEPLNHPNGSGLAEVLEPNGSGFQLNGSAVAVPIVPLERLPIDPGSDPKIRSSNRGSINPPSDPSEFRYPPEQLEVDTEVSSDLASTGRTPTGARETQSETEPVSSTVVADALVGGHVIRWPADEQVPRHGHPGWDPFVTYVDAETGEVLR